MRNIACLKAFKKRLKAGEILVGTMCEELRGGKLVKVLEESGCDFFFIDYEHGTFGLEQISDMIDAADFSRIIPIVRVPEIRKEVILKVLDLGAGGVMIPSIKTPEEARQAIGLAKYPPLGERGFASFKYYNNYSSRPAAELLYEANRASVLVLQIETRQAVECVSDIAAVSGADILLVGPGDLSLSLGHPGQPRHPDVVSAIEKVIAAARENGLCAGIHCGGLDDLVFWKSRGMTLLMFSSPLAMVYNATAAMLKTVREA